MARLREGYRSRQRRRPDLFPFGRERGLRTVREYDEAITAPHGGFGGADEYYAKSSAGPWLAAIDRPALVLAAEDDPMIPSESIAHWPLSSSVQREMVPSGGHVGFVRRIRRPGPVLGGGARSWTSWKSARREQRPQRLPHRLGNELLTLRVRVDAVREVQRGDAGDTFEQEGDESGPVLLRELRVERAEASPVGLPVVGKSFHARRARPWAGATATHAVEDGLDVLPRRVRVLAAQAVVGPRFEDEHRDRLLQQPVEPAQRPRRRLAAHARVHHAVLEAGLVDPGLDQRGKSLVGVEAIARSEAVAQEQDDRARCGR